ncbi:Procollagen-proline dioxygenase protein [Dioscorea alata]|uniref:Procollagen-proline dioxygenase protein n=2 Tax=Dioscorea alata TaxID=55571 RepID=A0ACB7TWP7_DIOAL|nr:Procollagen-proline dioxygenase protein [Dioscorea alata]
MVVLMKSGRARPLWSFPAVLIACAVLSFISGFFFASTLIVPDSSAGDPHRLRLTEMKLDRMPALPHGVTGEPRSSVIPFQILSWKPRAFYFPNFATAEQCEAIIQIAKLSLKPSTLALRKGETAESTQGIRTSSGTFVSASEDSTGTLDQIEQKIAKVTAIPREQGEAFNILRYEIGQRYASHYDAFSPAEYGPQKSQRIASFLLYLSDIGEGGETMFPFENGLNMDIGYDYEKCIGLKVKPRRGDGLLFYSLFTNLTIDPTSLHGSCPVIRGEKWVATKWIRDQIQY